MELCFLSLNDRILVGMQYYILLDFESILWLIRCYTVLYFLQKKSILLPTNYKIRGLIVSQNGANIHKSVPLSLYYLPTNLYILVVDFVQFRRLVEEAL